MRDVQTQHTEPRGAEETVFTEVSTENSVHAAFFSFKVASLLLGGCVWAEQSQEKVLSEQT